MTMAGDPCGGGQCAQFPIAMTWLLLVLAALTSSCAVLDTKTPTWREFATPAKPVPVIELYTEQSGTGDPVVLIHGFGNSTYTWRHIVPALARDHQVIAIDLKGFGKSPKPSDDCYSIYEQARLVRDYVVNNNLRNVTLVGHSYGGGVALIATLFLVDESPPRQRALVLIDSIAYPQELPSFIRLLTTPVLGPLLLNLVPPETQVREVMEDVFYDDTLISADAVKIYAEGLQTAAGRVATLATAKQILPTDLLELVELYPRIRIPTLIVWGRHDAIIPLSVGERLNAAIPGSSMVVIEGSGHAPQEEHPEALLPILQPFLDKVEVIPTLMSSSAIRKIALLRQSVE